MQHVRQPKRLCLLNPGSAIFDLSLDPCSQQSLLSSNDESRTITISERSARDNRVTSHLSPLTGDLSLDSLDPRSFGFRNRPRPSIFPGGRSFGSAVALELQKPRTRTSSRTRTIGG